ncbi:MAG: DUF3891 family protein [Acidobacteriota bacterium]
MIVYDEGETWLLTTQPDHATVSGELATLWQGHDLPENPRREAILFAAREHDNGWWEADSSPRVDPETGAPYTFYDLPEPVRRELWLRGIERFARGRPYSTLLIVEHAWEVHSERLQQRPGDWKEFYERLAERREALQEAAFAEREQAVRDYRFIEWVDLISLAACSGWERRFERHGLVIESRGDVVGLDPFPLAGATSFKVRCRRIPKRAYRGELDLGSELATARWEEKTLRVEPL